ncbi:MAG: hypothetical protein ICV59_09010 [Thermoleophilia bacterium]|nr:hypothetical protein [Thermoleophilia bacterium]
MRVYGPRANETLYPLLLAGYAAADEEEEGKQKLRMLANALVTMFVRCNASRAYPAAGCGSASPTARA